MVVEMNCASSPVTFKIYSEFVIYGQENERLGLPHRVEGPRIDVEHQGELDWPNNQKASRNSR